MFASSFPVHLCMDEGTGWGREAPRRLDGACPCPEQDATFQAAPAALGLESICGKG